jgi:pimeloyl-ACP methyl ester carboxylesterase
MAPESIQRGSRRGLLRDAAAITLLAAMRPLAQAASPSAATSRDAVEAVRPFRAHVAQSDLVDLRRRIAATRWPEAETVGDRSQGVQLAKLQALVQYWGTGYDWRKVEARLNALPQFVTNLDGLDIHFIHVRSRNPDAMPLVMTHGWPGSVLELLNTVAPLTDPAAHDGRAEDAFHLVLPSIPGFGFSMKPTSTGWNPDRIARAWDMLMKRLGYEHYAAQGGDWGAIICDALGRQAPAGLIGMHVNRVDRASTLPPDVGMALMSGEPAPASLSDDERAVFNEAREFINKGFGYAAIMGTRPQTIGYGLADSPVALAAWCYDKISDWVYTRGDPEHALGRDAILDDITLYWLTNTGTSSSRLYWENAAAGVNAAPITIPVGVTIFPGEVYRPPKQWIERAYRNLVYYHRVDKGGHFAAWEEPELFASEVRAAFRAMRVQ